MSARIFVGRLSYDVRERDLEKFFKGFGRIKEIVVKNGYGFVEFDDYRDADDAVYELNGKTFMGERVSVEHARGSPRGGDNWNTRSRRMPMRRRRGRDKYGPPTRTEYRLIVENLSSRVSWQDLKDYIRQAGEVTYADAHKQRRNQGIVELASYTDMKNAVEKLDDTEFNGRRIRLVEDKSRKRRSRSRSHSRSRSRSNARSRSRSPSKSHSRSRSRSKSRSHSKSKSPVHSRSVSKSPTKSKSRSRSPSRERSSRSKSASRSPPREENNFEVSND